MPNSWLIPSLSYLTINGLIFHLFSNSIWNSTGWSLDTTWVIRTRTGEKLDKCHIFFKSQKLLRTMKSKNSYTYKSYYLILALAVLKIWVSGFRRNLGCARYAQSWVFFQNFQNTAFLLLYYSASKKATAMVFIWGDRGYPAVRFEYKTASERYLIAEL